LIKETFENSNASDLSVENSEYLKIESAKKNLIFQLCFRISRFGNFLCNVCLAPSTDPTVIELAAKALARLTQVRSPLLD
jgi:hypothetical protein